MEHQKSYFWSLRLSGVTKATSLSGGTRDFLKLSFHRFPHNEILKVSKFDFEAAPQNTSKYQFSAKSIKRFGSYEHLKFRPTHRLK